MKIKVNRAELAKHIFIVQRAISARTTMQILEGILISCKDNLINLTATDTEISIISKMSALVEEEGEIVVNGRLFGNIIRKLNANDVYIKVENYNMNIKCGSSEFNISCQKADEYPELPKIEEDKTINFTKNEIKEAIRKTSFAVSLDETRIAFTGVYLDFKKDYINFVALDGFRLAIKKLNKSIEFKGSAIVPARSFNELVKILEDGKEDLKVKLSHNHIVFLLEDTVFYSSLISGDFFPYENLLKGKYKIKTEVIKSDFQNAVERASLLAKEDKANLIEINIKDNEIFIDSNSEIGNVHEIIPCSPTKEELRIAFNSKYILDGIKVMDTEKILLNFFDSVTPCIINEDGNDDYIYLVLPVRLAS